MIVQSWKPATPSAQPSHTPLRRMRNAHGRLRRFSQTVLRDRAVVVRLLLADAVRLPADPQIAARAARRCERDRASLARSARHQAARSMRSGCVYTLKRAPRRKPTTVWPKRSAAATARLDGADTAHSTGMPATAAFCTSSNDSRPETSSTCVARAAARRRAARGR